MARPFVLVLGATRSGKSRFGLARTCELAGGGRAWFVGTALAGDPELDARVERHRRERPASWRTVDAGLDLAATVRSIPAAEPVLIDGFMLWLAALTGEDVPDVDPLLDGPVAATLAAIVERPGPVVVVSDEIGGGLVPLDPLSRAFRDLTGLAHQRLAATADEVVLLTAGLPLVLKRPA